MSLSPESLSYIPLRLDENERKLLEVLNQALEVSEYTDVVDVTFSHTRKNKYSRIVESLVDILSISSGLVLATNLTKGERVVAGKQLADNFDLFRDMFEVGRRYKIMNPSKMRSTYGKLMYILMDTESDMIQRELKISLYKPILTVKEFLHKRNALGMLEDEIFYKATMSIDSEDPSSSSQIAAKKQANRLVIEKYETKSCTKEDIQRVLDSVNDMHAYYAFNVAPVDGILDLLQTHFDANSPEDIFSLSLRGYVPPKKSTTSTSLSQWYGNSMRYFGGGSCLSHDHATQFTFVYQSFCLWREIMANIPRLWYLADQDLTQESYYLSETGQGYQRLQQCPRVARAMREILSRVQNAQKQSWVGLSVVHLGDRDVPNALVFIDKYSQVPRILAPIVRCVQSLDGLVDSPAFHEYVSNEWGSITGLRKQILSDFFKHGFDGSGDDGGSCIDGRLTSAWNWCSQLYKKPYYYVFMFTGFQGFDGDFK